MYDVTFIYEDNNGYLKRVTLTSNYKTYQRNVNLAKKYTKGKGVFIEIVKIE